ncbi:hypothetical protein AZH11_11675 [Pseudomonas simiae]|nr:hypothetical protein AZH11_11675 [Pseudomonas simiae]
MGTDLTFRRRADLLKGSIDQQLAQLGHLLNAEHDCALGSIQVKGQVAGHGVQRDKVSLALTNRVSVFWWGFTVKILDAGGLGVGLAMIYSSDM